MRRRGSILTDAARRIVRHVRGKPSWREVNEARNFAIVASDEDKAIVRAIDGLTLTGPFRVHALLDAVSYVVARGIPGAFVECGVWRGGSVLAMLLKLKTLGVTDRDVYLYDTFDGMTQPTDADTSPFEKPATATMRQARERGERGWDHLFSTQMFNDESVRQVLQRSGYPEQRLHLVKGPVEETLPGAAPDRIALLRLDTDWYESTRHELRHLYPRLNASGVLIIDDYGHWEGCRKAVDEYFAENGAAPVLLTRVDYTCRVAIKN